MTRLEYLINIDDARWICGRNFTHAEVVGLFQRMSATASSNARGAREAAQDGNPFALRVVENLQQIAARRAQFARDMYDFWLAEQTHGSQP